MSHCRHFHSPPLNRRQMLARCASGFGGVALLALAAQRSYGELVKTAGGEADPRSPFAVRPPHFAAKAKSVIFLFMDGGPSQVDTFDPKPRLAAENGQPFKMKIEPTQFNNNGNTLASPWKFANRGQCGMPISDLFPHVAQMADELAVVRSMTSNFSEHTTANYFLHTGSGLQGRPSMGAWATYGLGSACNNLPGFIVLGGLVPPGGLDNFGAGFLPATFQGSMFKAEGPAVANVQPAEPTAELQQTKLDLLAKLDRGLVERLGADNQVESAIANYELAFRMQTAVPDLVNLDQETAETQRLYGLDAAYEPTRHYARQCLLARRLVERGVRFVELTCAAVSGGADRWDQHGNLVQGHGDNARAVDQPIGALLVDLKRRGLLDETLVVWTGEFGRTPFAQGSDGRDHNPFGFSLWLAGGGVKGGTIYGATDEYGYKAVEGKAEIHDLHATMLHLLGLDHKRLVYRWGGRDMRLTDVHGELIGGILA